MKNTIICFMFLVPVMAIAQYSEKDIKSDSMYFFIQKNACDSLVWWEGHRIILKDGRSFEPLPTPVGWNDKVDCVQQPDAFIKGRDTATLYNYFANTQIIDPGRQMARAAQLVIFDAQFKRALGRLDKTFTNSGLQSLFKYVEKQFAEDILGEYKYVTIGLDGNQTIAAASVIKRANGNYALRVGQNTLPLNIFGDEWIELTLPSGEKISLYRVGIKGRWSDWSKKYQIVAKESFIIDAKTVK